MVLYLSYFGGCTPKEALYRLLKSACSKTISFIQLGRGNEDLTPCSTLKPQFMVSSIHSSFGDLGWRFLSLLFRSQRVPLTPRMHQAWLNLGVFAGKYVSISYSLLVVLYCGQSVKGMASPPTFCVVPPCQALSQVHAVCRAVTGPYVLSVVNLLSAACRLSYNISLK